MSDLKVEMSQLKTSNIQEALQPQKQAEIYKKWQKLLIQAYVKHYKGVLQYLRTDVVRKRPEK